MKTELHLLNSDSNVWTFPQFKSEKQRTIKSARVEPNTGLTEDEDEIDDMEFDERFNIELINFDQTFPDPL